MEKRGKPYGKESQSKISNLDEPEIKYKIDLEVDDTGVDWVFRCFVFSG